MWIKIERWGIDVGVSGLIIRLVLGDVFIRIPLVGVVAWNHHSLSFDRWEDVKKDPIPKF
ncbi:hypothetical protein [Vreelandella indica]|uniref:hypothetical protein n=1 Tax=Vreelandella indica TaxID=3126500 RepID=UPI00300E0B8B